VTGAPTTAITVVGLVLLAGGAMLLVGARARRRQ
jgi:hypothetical protein